MDKTITARLYRVERENEAIPTLADALRKIDGIDGFKDRERKLAPYFDVRLEFLEEETSQVLSGEFLRIQSTNYPAAVSEKKRTALAGKDRLGHSIVFRYDHKLGVLGIQYDPKICGPSRLFSYIREFDLSATYMLLPILRSDAWARYNASKPKKVIIGVSGPSNLAVLDGDAKSASSAFATMGDAYSATRITIEISVGNTKGYLANITGLVSGLISASETSDATVDTLKVKGDSEDIPIDFLQDLMVFKEELGFHDRDPDVNYRIRRDYLKKVMHGVV